MTIIHGNHLNILTTEISIGNTKVKRTEGFGRNNSSTFF